MGMDEETRKQSRDKKDKTRQEKLRNEKRRTRRELVHANSETTGSVGVPPSEAFEVLAKSYHGWMPRNAKPSIAPIHCPR